MKILFLKSLCLTVGVACLPALATAQSYLPLPETSAPVYRPVSSYYAQDAATGSSLINHVGEPPAAEVNEVPSPSDTVMPSPAMSYGKSVMKGGNCGKGCSKGCAKGGCGSHGCLKGLVGGKGCWYGSFRAIRMDRDNDDPIWLSVFDDAIDVSVLSSHDATMDWTNGGELTVGRYLGCGCSALEFTYWGINPDAQSATVLDPNAIGAAPNLLSAFDFSTLNYDDGVNPLSSLDGWFDGARAHRVVRNWEYDNLELNFVHHSCSGCYSGLCGCQRRYNVRMACGLRYIDMDEHFRFEADDADTTFDGAIEEVRYSIDLENQLLGLQIGCMGDYCVNDCLTLHSTCKVGVYGNRINHRSFIGGSNGAAVIGAGPNAGEEFDIRSNKTDFAMVGELDLGASYQLSCRWRATAGYRIVALNGVALPGDQIPFNFADVDGVANIASNSSLLLHGGYAGLEFNY